MAVENSSVTLSDGSSMPILGFGTMDFQAEKGVVKAAVAAALQAGYRHLDCAAIYGNEREVGDALRETLPELGLDRKDVFITSKLPATAMRPSEVLASLTKTLADIQVEYLDLYLVHFPVPLKPKDGGGEEPLRDGFGVRDTWEQMELAKSKGLAKSIGVSNFNVMTLNDMLCWAKVPPVVNQIERHPYLVQQDLVDFCKDNNVLVCAYSPLGTPGTGLATDTSVPLLGSPVISKIGDLNKATPAQVLISWSLSQGIPALPKSVTPTRIAENFEAQAVTLSKEEIEKISSLDRGLRYFHQKWNGIPAFA